MNIEIARSREALAATTRLLIGQDMRVTQEGTRAYVELDPVSHRPLRINLPLLLEDADPKLVGAIQGFLDHEVAHVLFSDWTVAAEANRAGLAASHNLIEDVFIERAMGERFPGARHNLEQLRKFFCEDVVPKLLDEAPDEDARFGVLLVQAARAMAGQERSRRFMDDGGHWREPWMRAFVDLLGEDVVTAMPSLASSADCLDVARRWAEAAHALRQLGQRQGTGSDEGGGTEGPAAGAHKRGRVSSNVDEWPSEERGGTGETDDPDPGPLPRFDPASREPPLEDHDAAGAEPKAAGASPAGGTASGTAGRPPTAQEGATGEGRGAGTPSLPEARAAAAGATSSPAREAPSGDGEADRGSPLAQDPPGLPMDPFEGAVTRAITHAADEAVARASYRVFTRDRDRIEAPEVPADYQDEWLAELDRVTAGMAGAMQRDIERMMAARSRSAYVPGLRSGRLHSASLYRLAVGDDRVFRRKVTGEAKSTAVTLLVDNSASMRGRKMLVAIAAAYALATTLERVAIPCEVLGYTTDERPLHGKVQAGEIAPKVAREAFSRYAGIRMPLYKPFAQRLTPANRQRFAVAAMTESKNWANVDGESLQYAAMRLLPRLERRKVVLMLSDGMPAVLRGNVDELEAHLAKTVQTLGDAGIEVVGIGIMTNAVSRFYPRHLVLESLEDLPKAVMGELRRILET